MTGPDPTPLLLEKLPPQNLEAEKSVLGAMLIDPEAAVRVKDVLEPADFYREQHRILYQAICTLLDRGEAVDLVTLREELARRKAFEHVGGEAALAELVAIVPTSAHIDHYARIVEEKSVLRKLISAGTHIVTRAYAAEDELAEILDDAERAVFSIAERRHMDGFEPINPILHKTFDWIETLYQNKAGVTGVAAGFPDLDRLTSGFQPSNLIIVAARPSVGKTAFCLNIARNAAVEQKVPVAFFSLEMAKQELAMRLLCCEGQINHHHLRTGRVREDDWDRLSHALGRLSSAPLFIDDTPSLTVMDLRARARRLKAQQGSLGLVVVDYLQLMQSRRNAENRQQEISEISRSLKSLARELGCAVIAISQLSRAVETRQDRHPLLSDLRESGSIEQDADVVIFLYRDDYYNRESERSGVAEVIIAKQRNGPTATVELAYWRETGKFLPLANRQEERPAAAASEPRRAEARR